ncbi:hypothetical protein CSKR_102918 [Clonorchis sinensis]|uniref:Uncharacterized protein n=1 Tax=Clonorchis sinensis TaxID=79923 RepID=A0A419PR46_CLOSI|nr:hypothetical protein CSKR_102918 [Clonorchis sinensis]
MGLIVRLRCLAGNASALQFLQHKSLHLFQPPAWRPRRLFVRLLTIDQPGMRLQVSHGRLRSQYSSVGRESTQPSLNGGFESNYQIHSSY